MKKWITLVSLFPLLSCAAADNAIPLDGNLAPRKAPSQAVERWRDWRFGMFIHWGPVSLTAKELSWSRANTNPKCPNQGPTPADVYDHLYERFNPTNFDAREWVAIAKAAGMKYMVLTAKHCDGFLLWDSKVSDYNIAHTPFHRDACAELAKACHEAGMGLGWYFSPMDWKDPDCRNAKNAEFVKRMQAELTELLSNYGKIDVLWFDTDGRSAPWDQQNTYALVRKLQPDIMIDERLDLGDHGGWNEGVIGPWADFHTPEQKVGGFDLRPWESCMTVSSGNQWSWDGNTNSTKPFEQCMNMLINCAGGNGNMLLDVGPMPDGRIAPAQANLIKKMGGWLAKNGESIYGTRGGPWKPAKDIASTRKHNTVYLHVLKSENGRVELTALPVEIKSASRLDGGKVDFSQKDGKLSLVIPSSALDPVDTVVKLEL